MDVIKTSFDKVIVIEPKFFCDERGFFLESYQRSNYIKLGIDDNFVQDNHSRSVKDVLRGLHYQIQRPQAQIVTVMRGRIFDVTVDLRSGSATFGKWFGVELSDDGPRQIYMPPGFAHGFCVLSDWADLHYKVSRFYDPKDEGGLLWDDADIGIKWPIDKPNISSRDASYPKLKKLTRDMLPCDY